MDIPEHGQRLVAIDWVQSTWNWMGSPQWHSLVLWNQFMALATPWMDREMHAGTCVVPRQECEKYQLPHL